MFETESKPTWLYMLGTPLIQWDNMKKSLSILFILLGLVFSNFVSGYAQLGGQPCEHLEITKLRCWHEAANASVSNGGWGATNANPNRWKVEFNLKNISEKQVALLLWSFRFINKKGETVIQDFKTKGNVKPGKNVMVVEEFDFSANNMPEAMIGNIFIRRLEFADGTSWQPKPDGSDPALIKSPQ